MEFIITNKAIILAAVFALSEVLALIPSVKSNSIFEVVVKVLSSFLPKAPAA
jgi:hypothetical protein